MEIIAPVATVGLIVIVWLATLASQRKRENSHLNKRFDEMSEELSARCTFLRFLQNLPTPKPTFFGGHYEVYAGVLGKNLPYLTAASGKGNTLRVYFHVRETTPKPVIKLQVWFNNETIIARNLVVEDGKVILDKVVGETLKWFEKQESKISKLKKEGYTSDHLHELAFGSETKETPHA